jgi:hypothetical protein
MSPAYIFLNQQWDSPLLIDLQWLKAIQLIKKLSDNQWQEICQKGFPLNRFLFASEWAE